MDELLKDYYEKFKIHDDEEFKFCTYPDVTKYKYVISNYGRVFSFVKQKEKKTYYDKDGYIRVSLCINKKKIKRRNTIVVLVYIDWYAGNIVIMLKERIL